MKYSIVIALFFVLLMGCACPRCYGQAVIDATQAQEFKETVIDMVRRDPVGLANLIFKVATNADLPSATQTVSVNAAQNTRWFDETKSTSFMAEAYWNLGNEALKTRANIRATVLEKYAVQVNARVANETKKQRILAKIEYLLNPTAE